MRHNKATALALTAAPVVRLWNRQSFASGKLGIQALRGYRL
jgi:hypothetical protein